MAPDEMQVRLERATDRLAVRAVNEATFGRPAEADLVENLQREGEALASFVAESNQQIIGHILFTRVVIERDAGSVRSVALAPMAVLPSHQRQGIGTALIQSGLEILRERGERSVLVLGDPKYYSRFGFTSAAARNLVTPFPPDAFMALTLVSGGLDGICGTVGYPRAFGL
jgi:putative acetyltransferase